MTSANFSNTLNEKVYDYSFIFYFEKKCYNQYIMAREHMWMSREWTWSIFYACLYIALIMAGERLMRNREKFRLQRTLVAWNIVLAAFSILGTIRFVPYFVSFVLQHGIEESICYPMHHRGLAMCWIWYFILSKMVELIDTMFIILRKQKLIFLHWYHHATVLVYTWYAASEDTSTGRWFTAMNYFVHSLMYTYFAFRAMRFSIPKWINIVITSLQLSQMLVGIFVNTIAYMRKSRGQACHVTYANIYWSFFMYLTYFVLFYQFFRANYLKKKSSSSSSSSCTKNQSQSSTLSHAKSQ